jgi:hypothetical protein
MFAFGGRPLCGLTLVNAAILRFDIVRPTEKAESGMTEQYRKESSVSRKPKPSKQKKKYNNELLDEALDETFPASDPVAMLEPVPNSQQSDNDEGK